MGSTQGIQEYIGFERYRKYILGLYAVQMLEKLDDPRFGLTKDWVSSKPTAHVGFCFFCLANV